MSTIAAKPFEICFRPMPDSVVQLRGGGLGMWAAIKAVTYRCGMCNAPVDDSFMAKHAEEHYTAWQSETQIATQ